MTNKELNKYILHYIEQDHTKSAIMLTGGWGTGKSHYIQNELIPFLSSEENGNHQCIFIPLYGLTQLSEVSKIIFFELKSAGLQQWFSKNISTRIPDAFKKMGKEAMLLGSGVGKTVIKGILSTKGIEIGMSEKDLKKLYQSIVLNDKLLIFEDVERSAINILDFLGYVNSLVEQDGVKVLLVANEDEIIKYEPLVETDPEKKKAAKLLDKLTKHETRSYTPETEEYLVSKEKTISDTLIFEGDVQSAIREIIQEFHNEKLSQFSGEGAKEIENIMNDHEDYNLRSFLFACQKANDIYQLLPPDGEYNKDFLKTILMGIICFSLKIKIGEECKWDKGSEFSFELGNEQYPLFRFCYEYILYQRFDEALVQPAQDALEEFRLYDRGKSSNDPDLIVLNYWYLQSDKDVLSAVRNITTKLENQANIAFHDYENVAFNLIKVSHLLTCDISQAKKHMINNLYGKSDKIRAEYLFSPLERDNDIKVMEEYNAFKAEMINALNARELPIFGFTYRPEDINTFYSQVLSNEGLILTDRCFATRLDIPETIELLKNCTAAQIHDFRGIFLSVYRASNIGQFLGGDRHSIEKLLFAVKDLEKYEKYDVIQRIQIHYFTENLEDILTRL